MHLCTLRHSASRFCCCPAPTFAPALPTMFFRPHSQRHASASACHHLQTHSTFLQHRSISAPSLQKSLSRPCCSAGPAPHVASRRLSIRQPPPSPPPSSPPSCVPLPPRSNRATTSPHQHPPSLLLLFCLLALGVCVTFRCHLAGTEHLLHEPKA